MKSKILPDDRGGEAADLGGKKVDFGRRSGVRYRRGIQSTGVEELLDRTSQEDVASEKVKVVGDRFVGERHVIGLANEDSLLNTNTPTEESIGGIPSSKAPKD